MVICGVENDDILGVGMGAADDVIDDAPFVPGGFARSTGHRVLL